MKCRVPTPSMIAFALIVFASLLFSALSVEAAPLNSSAQFIGATTVFQRQVDDIIARQPLAALGVQQLKAATPTSVQFAPAPTATALTRRHAIWEGTALLAEKISLTPSRVTTSQHSAPHGFTPQAGLIGQPTQMLFSAEYDDAMRVTPMIGLTLGEQGERQDNRVLIGGRLAF